MSKPFIIFSLLLICLFVFPVAAEEAFAPKAVVPAGAPEWYVENFAAMLVPTTDEVGIPAPPGAMVVGVQEGGDMVLQGETYRMLPRVFLLTVAEPDEVIEFLREYLNEQGEELVEAGNTFFFFEGGPDDPLLKSMLQVAALLSPTASVRKVIEGFDLTDHVPGAVTHIELTYLP